MVGGWRRGTLHGDYTIFLGRQDAFGLIGHPWERSLCAFGAPAVDAFVARNVEPASVRDLLQRALAA